MIIDTHAHLSDERLRPLQEEILSSAQSDGIERIVEVGADYDSSVRALDLARRYDCVYAAVGTHPHDAERYDRESEEFYAQAARDPKTVAIGEIGLDYHYDLSPRDVQKKAFARQLILARKVSLPVILHIREAYRDALDILTEYRECLGRGVLLHCYQGSVESVREFNRFDCYYAFGGSITFKNARKEDIVRAVPPDRLLVETDCPYMTPVPYRGTPNQPKYINYTVDKLAEILRIDREEVVHRTTENARRFFDKMK